MPKIKVDKKKCIGCGACVNVCNNFKLVNGKSVPKKANVEKITCEKKAANSCPVDAISISN